jgi:hypothetical protein
MSSYSKRLGSVRPLQHNQYSMTENVGYQPCSADELRSIRGLGRVCMVAYP